MNEAEDFIRSTIERHGWFDKFSLELLGNSGNNRVYRADGAQGAFIVKSYFQHPDDPRDRFSAERAFYLYLWNAGIRRTPEPMHWLPDERLAVFEFIAGEKPAAATPEFIREALQFFRELNGKRDTADLPAASEACFSLRGHLDCVGRRVAKLQDIAPDTDVDSEAAEFVAVQLAPKWNDLSMSIQSAGSLDEELSRENRCVSPSDFGFHNSILAADGKLRFFDFEYAGSDDPAKTVCDFFCQPAVPVDRSLLPGFLAEAVNIFPRAELEKRVKLLLPLYQLKWCCIMLNEFLPASAARRRFAAGAVNEPERKATQLARAKILCATITVG